MLETDHTRGLGRIAQDIAEQQRKVELETVRLQALLAKRDALKDSRVGRGD
jgi:hypothetical protein